MAKDQTTEPVDGASPAQLRAALRALLAHADPKIRNEARRALDLAMLEPWSVSHMQATILRAICWAGKELHAAKAVSETVRHNVETDRLDRLQGWIAHLASDPRARGQVGASGLKPTTLRQAVLTCARGLGHPDKSAVKGNREEALAALLSELNLPAWSSDALKKFVERNVGFSPEDEKDLGKQFPSNRDARRKKTVKRRRGLS